MDFGVRITHGPQSWQILQQSGGTADIPLEGSWRLPDFDSGVPRVFARVVREDSGDTVCPWTECRVSDENLWNIVLTGIPAGGLYRVETCIHADEPIAMEWGYRGDMIHHLGVGDLFVIAGQSNSAGFGKDPAYDPPEIGVHLLRNSGRWDLASHPLNDSTGSIHEANCESFNPGTSPWLSFGRTLKRELGYPIGLLQTALGGSPMEEWNPEEKGLLYRNMREVIHSQGGVVRGVLWYQGCEDTHAGRAEDYLPRFAAMVARLRRDIGLPELPFFTIQLNHYMRKRSDTDDCCWGLVREAQRQAAHVVAHVTVTPSIDCPQADAIHNSSVTNITLGQRVARVALARLYGRRVVWAAPDIRSAELGGSGKTAVLHFDSVFSRLYDYNVTPAELDFSFEDAGGPAAVGAAVFRGNRIEVQLERPLRLPAFVSCAAGQNPRRVVPVDYDTHLPILPFYRVPLTGSTTE